MSDLSKESIQREIEAKRKKLEELKAKRLNRQSRVGGSVSEPNDTNFETTPTRPISHSMSALTTPSSHNNKPHHDDRPTLRPSSTQAILDSSNVVAFVNQALASSSVLQTPPHNANLSLSASSPSLSSPVSTSAATPISTPMKPLPTLHQTVLTGIDIPGIERIVYNASSQTTESALVNDKAEESGASSSEVGAIIKERDALRLREAELMSTLRELKEEKERRDAENAAATTPAPLSATEATAIQNAPPFRSWFSRAALHMERALSLQENLSYDFTIDYTADDVGESDASRVKPHKFIAKCTFADHNTTLSRPVSAIDFSPKYPELMLAAYAQVDTDDTGAIGTDGWEGSSAAGTVCIWNAHLSSRPEYVFTADSSVLTAFFHPTNPRTIIGSTVSGQLLMWDTRSKSTPVHRTSLTHSHVTPVYACSLLPAHSGVHTLVSVSTDGQLSVWDENNWHQPQHTTSLKFSPSMHSSGGTTGLSSGLSMPISSSLSREDIFVQSIAFPPRDSHTVLCGSAEGAIYKARFYETKDQIIECIRAHDAPISNLTVQPSTACTYAPPHLASTLLLSSSYDWTVKLWSSPLTAPLATFEGARDYVTDCAWHPINPALFVSADSTGCIDAWDLSNEWELPSYSFQIPIHKHGDTTDNLPIINSSTNATSTEASDRTHSHHAISRLRWNASGNWLAAGTSNGTITLFECARELMELGREDAEHFWENISKRTATSSLSL
jgi:dynein intermediate chain